MIDLVHEAVSGTKARCFHPRFHVAIGALLAFGLVVSAGAQTANYWRSTGTDSATFSAGLWSLGSPLPQSSPHHIFLTLDEYNGAPVHKSVSMNRTTQTVHSATLASGYQIFYGGGTATGRTLNISTGLTNAGEILLASSSGSFRKLVYSGTSLDNTGTLRIATNLANESGTIEMAASNTNVGTIRLNVTASGGTAVLDLNTAGTFINQGTVTASNTQTSGSATIKGVANTVYRQALGTTGIGAHSRFEVGSLEITGGTFELDGDVGYTDRIENSVAVTLAGGTLVSNGRSEREATGAGMGGLTVAGSSTINFGEDGGSILWFASYAHTAGTLTMLNWGGTVGQFGGSDQLRFSQELTQAELDSIAFTINPTYAAHQSYFAADGGYWEVAAIPEPGALLLTLLGAGALAIRRRIARRGSSSPFRG